MNDTKNTEKNYVGYEYMEVSVKKGKEAMYTDGYRNFGWDYTERNVSSRNSKKVTLCFKRDRAVRKTAELSRLQRQFEAGVREIEMLEQSQTTMASAVAYAIGILGTAAMAGSVFSYLNGGMFLMVVLAIPGFIGWILPYFCFREMRKKKVCQTAPVLEQKEDEIYQICEQGYKLLHV